MIVNAERDKSQHCNVIVDVPTRVYSSRLGMRIQNANSQKHSLRTTRSRVCFFFFLNFTYIPGHVTKTKTGRNQGIDRSVRNPTVHTPYAPQASSWNHPYGGPIRPMFC